MSLGFAYFLDFFFITTTLRPPLLELDKNPFKASSSLSSREELPEVQNPIRKGFVHRAPRALLVSQRGHYWEAVDKGVGSVAAAVAGGEPCGKKRKRKEGEGEEESSEEEVGGEDFRA
ncbi:hypothetical protein V496_00169 [Pseudogymnoascus sp. VKM F-4515 (FW-2607)]|nr:hypothetical protein V496_00169 [Pseudogymnoascus sp. VKM F-4515 (FW-2607)]